MVLPIQHQVLRLVTPITVEGTYPITLVVNDGISDSVLAVATITITDANVPPYIDLVMMSVSGPGSVSTGSDMTVSGTIVNQGTSAITGAINGYVSVRFYLSQDAIYDSSDVRLGEQWARFLSIGQPKKLDYTFRVPVDLVPGDYHLLAMVDRNNFVPEQDDPDNLNGNNLAVAVNMVTISIGADLAMMSVSGPGSASIGSDMTVSGTIVNQGSSAFYGYVSVGFYLSQDAVYDSRDAMLGNKWVSSLSIGQSKVVDYTFRVPVNLAPGDYHLSAIPANSPAQ